MSLREYWQAVQEKDQQQAEADGAGHRPYAKAWELHKAGRAGDVTQWRARPCAHRSCSGQDAGAEQERRAALHGTFARAEIVMVFRALDVQIRTGDDIVYTIGNHDPLTQTNSSRPLGLLAGAEAMVTDVSQIRCHGRSVLLPLPVTVLGTKTVADAAVVFPDGTVHIHALHGNGEVRKALNQSRGSTSWLVPLPRRSPRWTPGAWCSCRTCTSCAKRAC